MSRPPPKQRELLYKVGAGRLATMIAGRVSYRLVVLATTLLLLVVWGEQRYGTYAAALATFSWLMVFAVAGPEKTLLKLRPRAPRIGAAASDALVAVLWWAPLPLLTGFTISLWRAGPEALTTVYLGVAGMQLSVGCTMLLVAMLRAAGRTRPDAASFLTMSAVELVLLAGAVLVGLGPAGFAAAVTVLQLIINAVLSAALGRPSLRIFRRPRLLRRLGYTAVLLASPDLYLYLATAVLFALLAASAHAGQLGRLFAVLLVWSAGVNLLTYLLRVYAPRTSLRLAGRAGPPGRVRAARLGRWVAAGAAGWLVGVAGLLTLTDLAATDSRTGLVMLWFGLLAVRTPVLAGLLWATFQLENTDATAPRVVGLASVTGLAVLTLAGLVAVPAYGGAGLILAAGAGELGYGLVLAIRAAPRAQFPGATAPRPASVGAP